MSANTTAIVIIATASVGCIAWGLWQGWRAKR